MMNARPTPTLSHQALAYFRNPQVGRWRKLGAFAALAYLVLPMDAIPDAIPLLGWLDDVGVLSVAVTLLLRDVKKRGAGASTLG